MFIFIFFFFNPFPVQVETSWTVWLGYDELGKWQRQADRDYGPKINELLRAKWTECEVEFGDEANPPVV